MSNFILSQSRVEQLLKDCHDFGERPVLTIIIHYILNFRVHSCFAMAIDTFELDCHDYEGVESMKVIAPVHARMFCNHLQ